MPREYLPYAVIETAFIFTDPRFQALPPLAKLIYLMTWCRAFNERRSTLPPHVAHPMTTARDTGIDLRTTRKYVQLLHDTGLTIMHEDGSITVPGVRGKSNLRWKDDPPEGEKPAQGDQVIRGKTRTQSRQEGGMGNGECGDMIPNDEFSPLISSGDPPPKERRRPGKKGPQPKMPLLFGAFWKDYPKKVAKHEAIKAWNGRLADGNDVQPVLDALPNYIEFVRRERKEKKYIMNSATFIRGRWEEFVAGESGHPPWEDGMARASDYTNESAEDKTKRRRKTDEHNRRVRKKIEDEERREKEKLAAGATTDAD